MIAENIVATDCDKLDISCQENSLVVKYKEFNTSYKETLNEDETETTINIRYNDSLIYQGYFKKKENITILGQISGMSNKEKKNYISNFFETMNCFLAEFSRQKDKQEHKNDTMLFNMLKFSFFPVVINILFGDFNKSVDEHNDSMNIEDPKVYEAVHLLYFYYPNFKLDLEIFKTEKIIEVSRDGSFLWNKKKFSQKFSAEYFAYQAFGYPENQHNDGNNGVKWEIICTAFKASGFKPSDLSNTLSTAKLSNPSKHFEKYKRLFKPYTAEPSSIK